MADTDRRTTIDGDQITDHTVTKEELETDNAASDGYVLSYQGTPDKMRWIYLQGSAYGVGENIYEVSEDESYTNSINFSDKIVYTNDFEVGTYRVAFYAEGKAQTSQTEYEIILEIDGVEYCAELGNSASPEEWDTCYGFLQISFLTETSHIFKVRYRATKANKIISIRRARLEIWRMLAPQE